MIDVQHTDWLRFDVSFHYQGPAIPSLDIRASIGNVPPGGGAGDFHELDYGITLIAVPESLMPTPFTTTVHISISEGQIPVGTNYDVQVVLRIGGVYQASTRLWNVVNVVAPVPIVPPAEFTGLTMTVTKV